MAFDYKKEFKELYAPKAQPSLVEVPAMPYITVRGKGDPNQADGEYAQAIQKLYAVAYTIRMSYKGDKQIPAYFQFVVPPLEGFWWQKDMRGFDPARKDLFDWLSVIRMPDFVTPDVLAWAQDQTLTKKKIDTSEVELKTIHEGLCVQMLHVGPFSEEQRTVDQMHEWVTAEGYQLDFSEERHHHEIYLSDIRKMEPAKWRTIIRHPIK